MAVTTPHTEKLVKLLDPHRKDFNVLKEALKAVAKEDGVARIEQAKKLIRDAMGLKQQMDAAERTFQGAKKKFDKQLGKLVRKLEAMAAGQDTAPDEEKEEKETDDAAE